MHRSIMTVRQTAQGLCLLACCLFISACNKDLPNEPKPISSAQSSDRMISPIPTAPGVMRIPDNNPMTPEKIALGKFLFFDKMLGVPFTQNGKTTGIACASCHSPERAFSDNVTVSPGINGLTGTRNAPTLVNTGYNIDYTWDGKYHNYEAQAFGPIINPVEMGNNFNSTPGTYGDYFANPGGNDTAVLFKRLLVNHPGEYPGLLMKAYGEAVFSVDRIVKALACFERTIVSTGSPFDEYNKFLHYEGGSESAISLSAKRGFALFTDSTKTNCVSCHSGYSFTNDSMVNNGLAEANNDKGRIMVTYNPAHRLQFKIPTLRNVAITGPYMHDGRFATLEQVLYHYVKGADPNSENVDPRIHPLNLTQQEVKDIIAFLRTLTDSKYTSTAQMLLSTSSQQK
jgi:cytochrome c peroxidase